MPISCSISECLAPVLARGWCRKHYLRWYKHGHPLSSHHAPHGEAMRFFLDVVLPFAQKDRCLIWPFGKPDGRGVIKSQGSSKLVARLVCEMVYGPAPKSKPDASHTCTGKSLACVNPHHLHWSNRKQTCEQMIDRGTRKHGTDRHNVKLSDAAVRRIRSLRGRVLQRELAERFGVHQVQISAIQLRKRWRHIA